MQNCHEEGEEIFFDSLDYVRISSESSSPEDPVIEDLGVPLTKLNYDIWVNELRSIHERRERFMHGIGFKEAVQTEFFCQPEIQADSLKPMESLGLERVTECSGASLDYFSSIVHENENLDCCIRDLDSGKSFLVHEFGQDGLPSLLKEVDSGRLITLQEFEKTLGLFCHVQLMHREVNSAGEKYDTSIFTSKKKSRNWWKKFVAMVAVRNSGVPKTTKSKKVHHSRKRCAELTAVYMRQEMRGHSGSICTMKFSPDGRYLATGGEDCVVRIWRVAEVDSSCKCVAADDCPKLMNSNEGKLTFKRKSFQPVPVVVPAKIFWMEEKPAYEFRGHASDVLDLSWSKSNCLLTASKDKTVRMWQVGQDACIQVFQHNNYVTCIQFNPIDDGYFVSGSIDGKVRIWGVKESRVVDWVEVRDIVTAVCYRPDGQGFIVGTIAGNCRFYDSSGNGMQLERQLTVQGKKRSIGKRITGFQFGLDGTDKVMITSADSKVRILDGNEITHKFRGRSKGQYSASFTEDGRYIVSVGDDSRIYIWNFMDSSAQSSRGLRSVRSCEHFLSEGALLAVPWPGLEHKLAPFSGCYNSSQTQKGSEQCTHRDLDRFSVISWFSDGLSKISATTWPEEKLLQWAGPVEKTGQHSHAHFNHLQCNHSNCSTWGRVIVAAGRDGIIRTFHNYGLPIRL